MGKIDDQLYVLTKVIKLVITSVAETKVEALCMNSQE